MGGFPPQSPLPEGKPVKRWLWEWWGLILVVVAVAGIGAFIIGLELRQQAREADLYSVAPCEVNAYSLERGAKNEADYLFCPDGSEYIRKVRGGNVTYIPLTGGGTDGR